MRSVQVSRPKGPLEIVERDIPQPTQSIFHSGIKDGAVDTVI
jgi:hypothetical protein